MHRPLLPPFLIVGTLTLALSACATSPPADMTLAASAAKLSPPATDWQTVTGAAPARVAAVAVAPSAAAPIATASLTRTAAAAGRQHELVGLASYYWQDQMTATGERFDKTAMTAAHKTLPFGTIVRVTHAASGRSVVVRINDRGPFKPGRIIDLSEAAARELRMTDAGLAKVHVDIVR